MANQRARHWLVSLLSLAVFLLVSPRSSAAQTRDPFLGSVPTGQATGTTLDLSLQEAFAAGAEIQPRRDREQPEHSRRARRAPAQLERPAAQPFGAPQRRSSTARSALRRPYPAASSCLTSRRRWDPSAIADARAYLSQEIFNWSDIKNWKSASASEKASQYTYKSDRNLVVFTTGNAYLLVISDMATVDSVRAQVTTAQTLVQNDVDLNKHGLIASIDLLRARVEFQTQQQRLIAAENQVAIDKLTLARVIGLPNGQEFRLTDSVPYAALDGITQEQALQQALSTRPDYLSAKAQVRAAELARQAVAAENYPSLSTDTNYGDIGSPNFGSSHGTLGFAVTLNVPIFQGSRVRADKLQADSALQQRKAELADLEGQIDDQVRTAFFNLKSSSELVNVAESNIDLANQTLSQAQDRFRAGVADNLEVVQAQESVATANQSYITSLYAFNLAKISLAQAIGVAEQSALQYLGAK